MMEEILINPYEQIDQFEPNCCFARYKIKAHKTIFIQRDGNSIVKNYDSVTDSDEPIDDNISISIDTDIASLNQKFNDNQKSLIETQEKQNKDRLKFRMKSRINYGYGPEFEKLRLYPHYKQPYTNCAFYNALKRPSKNFINNLGNEYNKYFHQCIEEKKMPKFTRNHKRNLGLAIWFFEDIFPMIFSWLKDKGLINQ